MLDGGTLASWIARNFAAVLPVTTIRSYEGGVLFTGGHAGVSFREWVRHKRGSPLPDKSWRPSLAPGIHWYLPWFQRVETVNVTQEAFNLPTQSVTTQDGIAVTFSANIAYEIVDPYLYYVGVHDFEDSMHNIAMSHLARRVREQTWDDLMADQKKLERSLEGTLTTKVKGWGVEIHDVGLTDLVRARTFRLYGDPITG